MRRRFSQRGANWDGRRIEADLQPNAPRAATHSDALHGRPAEPLNVTLAHLATSPSNVTLERHPPSSDHLFDPPPTRPSRSALRGAGTVGSPPGRLVPRLTIRPALLAPAALAPLTASSGRGFRLPAVDVGPLRGRKPRSTSPALVRQPWPPVSPTTRLAASRDHVQGRCVSPVPSFPGIEPGND